MEESLQSTVSLRVGGFLGMVVMMMTTTLLVIATIGWVSTLYQELVIPQIFLALSVRLVLEKQ